jgi:hypothetical protein
VHVFSPEHNKVTEHNENNLEWNMKDHNEQGMLKSTNSTPKKNKNKNKKDVVHAK